MKNRITWFVIGFTVSWLTWSVVGYMRSRPRDHTATWSANQQALAPDWFKKANRRHSGHFIILTAEDPKNAAAYIHPRAPNQYPGVMIQDENADGKPDQIVVIADSTLQSFSLYDETFDGVFDSFTYFTGFSEDSMSFTDNNLDGQYDMRIGPGATVAVAIDGQWYDLISTNKTIHLFLGLPT